MSTDVIVVKTEQDVPAAATRGAKALRQGKLVAFATETVYGVAASASDAEAMRRLREIKSRPDRPFTVHVAGPEDVGRYVGKVPPAARRLMARAWPGPVTVLLETGGRLAEEKLHKARLHRVLCRENVIGLRCPDEPVARAILSAVPDPVVMPSANPAGIAPPRTAGEVLALLEGQIDLLIDSGTTRYGKGSTIVQFRGGEWSIVREGVLDARTVRRLTRVTYLFVCTGNTCRSPLAAALARRALARRLGCRPGELRRRGVEVLSAGLYAAGDSPATPEAIRAGRDRGADLSRHRSRKLTDELIESADVIFCMTGLHVDQVQRLTPSASRKARRLDPEGDIPDPIGGGMETYVRIAERIERAIETYLDKESE